MTEAVRARIKQEPNSIISLFAEMVQDADTFLSTHHSTYCQDTEVQQDSQEVAVELSHVLDTMLSDELAIEQEDD
jgi:hypothetical protein